MGNALIGSETTSIRLLVDKLTAIVFSQNWLLHSRIYLQTLSYWVLNTLLCFSYLVAPQWIHRHGTFLHDKEIPVWISYHRICTEKVFLQCNYLSRQFIVCKYEWCQVHMANSIMLFSYKQSATFLCKLTNPLPSTGLMRNAYKVHKNTEFNSKYCVTIGKY